MAIINETSQFTTTIPAAERGTKITADFTNQQIKALADRTQWLKANGGSSSASIILEYSASLDADYTITAGKNAFLPEPLTIEDGVTLTIPDGSKIITLTV